MSIPLTGRNLTVIARNATDGLYYKGYIVPEKQRKAVTRPVYFFYTDEQDVPRKDIIAAGGATPWPELKRGDYVLAKVRCKTTSVEYFVPGVVNYVLPNLRMFERLYRVELPNKRLLIRPRCVVIKIGRERYNDIVDYIKRIKGGFAGLINRQSQELLKLPPVVTDGDKEPARTSKTHLNDSKRSNGAEGKPARTSKTHLNDSKRSNGAEGKGRFSYTNATSLQSVEPPPLTGAGVVLARWSDDGWFYYGRIVSDTGASLNNGTMYTVMDINNYKESIKREDILTEEDQTFSAIQPRDHVIALHPKYVYSYAPAIVKAVFDRGAQVCFFDNAERILPWSEVYQISESKYNEYVTYIKGRMNDIVGQVIARDDTTGFYKQYEADAADHNAQHLFLKMLGNAFKKQRAIHVFSRTQLARQNQCRWRYVLAPLNNCTAYIPAEVTKLEPLELTYPNGTKTQEVQLADCFFINEEYYKAATRYLKHHYAA